MKNTSPRHPERVQVKPALRAVIFDFDGVIADTETLHFETFAAALEEVGIGMTREDSDSRFLGVSDAGCFEIAFRDAGRQLSPEQCEELVARKAELYHQGVEAVQLFPGARRLILEALARGPSTIASCGRRQDIKAVLERHDLSEFFPRFVGAEDIEHSKPDPQCFLKALEVLRSSGTEDLEPEECVVFEDSFRGVEAARRARMRCVAITHSYPADKLSGADWVVDSLEAWRWP